MQLTPEQIEGRDFSPELKGFDPVEVREFLRVVAADYRDLSQHGRSRLTVADIEGRTFGTQLRGFAFDEVREFLGTIASAYRAAAADDFAYDSPAQQQAPAPSAPSTSASIGDRFGEFGAEIAEVLRSATETARRITDEGERAAAATRAAADEDARRMRAEAADDAERTRREAKDRADAMVDAAEARVAELTEAERDVQQRLAEVEELLHGTVERLTRPVESFSGGRGTSNAAG